MLSQKVTTGHVKRPACSLSPLPYIVPQLLDLFLAAQHDQNVPRLETRFRTRVMGRGGAPTSR